jgi:DNA-binding response OmpR family regulator
VKVLLAEDEGITRIWLEDLLTEWGYDVVSAESGSEALEKLNYIDTQVIILLDWQLPEISGTEVCRRLKSDPGRSTRTYIIMLTGRDSPQERAIALACGADDFTTKPFEPADLKSRIEVGERSLASRS